MIGKTHVIRARFSRRQHEELELEAAPGDVVQIRCQRLPTAEERRKGAPRVLGSSSGGPIEQPWAPRGQVTERHEARPIEQLRAEELIYELGIPAEALPGHTYSCRVGIPGVGDTFVRVNVKRARARG